MADIYQIIENNGTPKNIEDRKARTNIAPYFNVNNANAAGDLILSDTGVLYKFNAAYSVGTSWNSRTSKEQVNIDDELKNRISQINSSISTINSNINTIDSSLAIVSNGNTHIALSAGNYIYIKNHNTLAEGLYTANSSIAANVALTSSNVTRVQKNGTDIGGLNDLSKDPVLSTAKSGTAYPGIGFKEPFVSNPVVSYSIESPGVVGSTYGTISVHTDSFHVYFYLPSDAGGDVHVNYIAFGFWK